MMKKAKMITNKNAVPFLGEHPWRKTNNTYNTREQKATDGEGLWMFRCDFDLPTGAQAAKIRATALGIFDLFINGKRVGYDRGNGMCYDEMKPEWTDYKHRVFFYEYDLLPLCATGRNTLLAFVSPGWWSGRMSDGYYTTDGVLAFCGEIEVTDADGRTTLYADTTDWKSAQGGCIRMADIWNGEYYDARVPDARWHPDAYTWSETVPYDGFHGVIEPFEGDPLRIDEALTRRPISAVLHFGVEDNGSDFGRIHVLDRREGDDCEVVTLKAGEHLLLDMGQNMVGRPAMTIKNAAAGTRITGIFAEMLNDSGERSRGNDGPAGSMYVENYRNALSRLTYIAAGTGREHYEPTHTYYGFRYLELTADGDVDIVAVRGQVIYSSMRRTGGIETDHRLVNQLISNILWGMRGNYFSNPTDCPQRDERYGWTGDTQIFCGAGAYFYDTHRFMRKWLGDVRCCQESYHGEVGNIIPTLPIVGRNAAAWGDAAIVVPHRMWQMFRDESMLAEHYEAMEAYMRSLEPRGLEGPMPTYGDWLCYEATDANYISICYYAYDAALMAQFSQILSRCETKYEARAAYYLHLRDQIITHWRERYLQEDGLLREDTQTGYLLALAFELVDEEKEPHVVEGFRARLRKKIEENRYRLSTGFVGTGILCQTLGKHGMNDLAYSLLLQTEDPSWLYSVLQGATTIWERWNSYTVEGGFGPVGMNSFNHYAYGAVAEWMFAYMAGIRPDTNMGGFSHFFLAPVPDVRTAEQLPAGQQPIRYVKAYYDTQYGRIESSWSKTDNGFCYNFTIPEGTYATAILPWSDQTLLLNGEAVSAAQLKAAVSDGVWTLDLHAGNYRIGE